MERNQKILVGIVLNQRSAGISSNFGLHVVLVELPLKLYNGSKLTIHNYHFWPDFFPACDMHKSDFLETFSPNSCKFKLPPS